MLNTVIKGNVWVRPRTYSTRFDRRVVSRKRLHLVCNGKSSITHKNVGKLNIICTLVVEKIIIWMSDFDNAENER